MIWAYHPVDPDSLQSLGSLRHQRVGSTSLNLLGGSTIDGSNTLNTSAFIIANENVTSHIDIVHAAHNIIVSVYHTYS